MIKNRSEKIKEAYKTGKRIHPMLGKAMNPNAKIALLKSHLGKSSWNKGKKWSEETKQRMSLAKKNKTFEELYGKQRAEEHKIKIGKANKGKIVSDETKLRMGMATKKRIKENPKYKEIMRQTRAKLILPLKDSSPEIRIQNFLREAEIEFLTHQYMHIEHGYQCDIFIPSMKLVIECDGDYWHGNPLKIKELNDTQIAQRIKDDLRTKELQEKGFRVIRLWESEIKVMDLNKLLEIINLNNMGGKTDVVGFNKK